MQEEECVNCGELLDVEVWTDGECSRCGATYHWEETIDEDFEQGDAIIIWE